MTIPNIKLTKGVWTNVYTSTSLPVGTKIGIQNLSSYPIHIQYTATTPTTDDGFVVLPYGYMTVPANVAGCYVISTQDSAGYVAVDIGAYAIPDAIIDPRVYSALKAFTVQSFIEGNVKNGTQWEFSNSNNSLAAGASQDTILVTGSKPVLVKSRQIGFTGTGVTARVYKSSVFSGGTVASVYNLNTGSSNTKESVVYLSPTVTSVGTEVAAPTYTIGSVDQGQRTVGTFVASGLERVLAPNSTFLLRITNNDNSACKIVTYVTFYEGEISSEN